MPTCLSSIRKLLLIFLLFGVSETGSLLLLQVVSLELLYVLLAPMVLERAPYRVLFSLPALAGRQNSIEKPHENELLAIRDIALLRESLWGQDLKT